MSPRRPRLFVATGNVHKLAEMKRLLPNCDVLGFADLQRAEWVAGAPEGSPWDVEESGATFVENAMIKAVHASRFTDLPVVADDSGLCVDALGGAPGVLSARHGGAGLDDRGRTELVLQEMSCVPDPLRGAHYRAALVLAQRGRLLSVHEGLVAGSILREPRGDGGFGYDPVFFLASLDRTMAEITPAEKDAISHRARAAAGLRAALAGGITQE